MKARRPNPKCATVIVTLETQHEVDALYCILNHTDIVEPTQMGTAFKALEPFVSDWHKVIYCRLEHKLDPLLGY